MFYVIASEGPSRVHYLAGPYHSPQTATAALGIVQRSDAGREVVRRSDRYIPEFKVVRIEGEPFSTTLGAIQ